MKVLLVAEFRNGSLLGSNNELVAFAQKIGAESSMFLVGDANTLPLFDGTLYLADASTYGEFNPDTHKQLLLSVIETESMSLQMETALSPCLIQERSSKS